MPDSITAIMPDSFTEGIAMALQNVYMYIYRYTRIYIYIYYIIGEAELGLHLGSVQERLN